MSGGRVLGGTIYAQVTTRAKWRVHTETAKARVIDFEALFTTREAHI